MSWTWLTGTTTTVSSSAAAAEYGQGVTLTATVSNAAASGNVEFYDGDTDLGGATLTSGSASLPLSALSPGLHSITAVYGGDGTYGGSTSGVFPQTILLTGTSTSIAGPAGTAAYGDSVTFSVTVGGVGPASGVPTGDVEFYDGGTDIGSDSLDDSGSASLTVSTLAAGTHSITAVYQGDGDFSASPSPAISLIVTPAATTTELDSPTDTVLVGDTVTLTASVMVAGMGANTPAGRVQFFDGSASLGMASLDGWGDATLEVSWPAAGTQSITADYCGGDNYAASASNAIPENVVTTLPTTDSETSWRASAVPDCDAPVAPESTTAYATLDIDATNTSAGMPDVDDSGNFSADIQDYTESIQPDPDLPGKIIVVDDASAGDSGIPNFARGITGCGYSWSSDADASPSGTFVPLVVTLPAGTNISSTQLMLSYSGSNPAEISSVGTAGSPAYEAADGYLRIWTVNCGDPRNGAGITDSGDYITPGVEFAASLLSWTPVSGSGAADATQAGCCCCCCCPPPCPAEQVTLYVEAVRPSITDGDLVITLSLRHPLWAIGYAGQGTRHGGAGHGARLQRRRLRGRGPRGGRRQPHVERLQRLGPPFRRRGELRHDRFLRARDGLRRHRGPRLDRPAGAGRQSVVRQRRDHDANSPI